MSRVSAKRDAIGASGVTTVFAISSSVRTMNNGPRAVGVPLENICSLEHWQDSMLMPTTPLMSSILSMRGYRIRRKVSSYVCPVWGFGFLLTVFAIILVCYYAFLQYSNFAKSFSPITVSVDALDNSFTAFFGGCNDAGDQVTGSTVLSACGSSRLGNIFIAYLLKDGSYASVDLFSVTFKAQVLDASWGSVSSSTTLSASSASQVPVLRGSLYRPAWFLDDTGTSSYMQGALDLDASNTHRVIQYTVSPNTSNGQSYASLSTTMEGGTWEIFRYYGGNPSISSESVRNPEFWSIDRFPWSNGTVSAITMLNKRKKLSFTSRWKYSETTYDILESGDNIEGRITLDQAAGTTGLSDLFFVGYITLDPAQSNIRYERVALMDYMAQIGGVAFFALICLWIIKSTCTHHCFRIEKSFIPRRSAFTRMIKKKRDELALYRRQLLMNPKVAKEAGIMPKDLQDFLRFREREELSRFQEALERAFVYHIKDGKNEEKSSISFAYSNATVEIDENDTQLAKIINIITAEKLSNQIEQMHRFLQHTSERYKSDAKRNVDS
ncbi:hypothetical protein AAMO2058_001705000 [Amorphochlora amoebiformis]